jgi:hypothetical protein
MLFTGVVVAVLFFAGAADATLLVVQDQTALGDSTTVQDAAIRGDTSQDQNFGIGTKPRITSGNARGALVWFDLSSIPAGQTIVSATLDLRLRPPGGLPHPVGTLASLSRVTESWGAGPLPVNEGTGWGTPALDGEVTWNSRMHGSTAWADPGLLTDGGGSRDMGFTVDMAVNDGNWHVIIDVASIVQTWLDGDPNYGFVLNDANNDPSRYYELEMSESADLDRRPKLTIEYVPEPAALALMGLGGLAVLRRRRRVV